MAATRRTNRLLFPLLGVALLGALVWQGRRIADGHVAAGATGTTPPAAGVVPQGSLRPTENVQAEGRLVTYPGAEVTVGSEVAGRIARLTVNEKDRVQRGEVIAELDASELEAAHAEAQAQVNEAEADLRLSEADLARLEPLAEHQVVSKQSLDRTRHDRDAAIARRDIARAAMQRLEAEIAKTRIVAPISGEVIIRYTNAGETIAPGSPIVKIADLKRVRVEAEVDEFDARRVALGDPVSISVEGAGTEFHGHVEEIPDDVVGRRINPQDPGRPTDARVLITKIALDAPTNLKLGQRVEVEIESSRRGDSAAAATVMPAGPKRQR